MRPDDIPGLIVIAIVIVWLLVSAAIEDENDTEDK